MINGDFGAPEDLSAQSKFFKQHIGSWGPQFFSDLESAPSAFFYQPVASIGQIFFQIETEAFSINHWLREEYDTMTQKIISSRVKALDRRAFFKTAGIVAVGGVAVATAAGSSLAESENTKPSDKPTSSRYRETDHVRKAYKLARF